MSKTHADQQLAVLDPVRNKLPGSDIKIIIDHFFALDHDVFAGATIERSPR